MSGQGGRTALFSGAAPRPIARTKPRVGRRGLTGATTRQKDRESERVAGCSFVSLTEVYDSTANGTVREFGRGLEHVKVHQERTGVKRGGLEINVLRSLDEVKTLKWTVVSLLLSISCSGEVGWLMLADGNVFQV